MPQPPAGPPPVADDRPPVVNSGPSVSRLRWWIHLVVLGSYPLVIGGLSFLVMNTGFFEVSEEPGAALSGDPVELLTFLGLQLGIFFFVFGLAWAASRATGEQLMLGWGRGWGPVWRGFLYSIGLRALIAAGVLSAVGVAWAFGGLDMETLSDMRPKVEHTIDVEVLPNSPAYLILNATVVSFVFAGFREELWRVGVLAAMAVLWPRMFRCLKGRLAAVGIVAVIFGLGHMSQGLPGVLMTTLLGAGLGAIIVFHRSIWDAVLAHGFFDATTFVLLYVVLKYLPEIKLF